MHLNSEKFLEADVNWLLTLSCFTTSGCWEWNIATEFFTLKDRSFMINYVNLSMDCCLALSWQQKLELCHLWSDLTVFSSTLPHNLEQIHHLWNCLLHRILIAFCSWHFHAINISHWQRAKTNLLKNFTNIAPTLNILSSNFTYSLELAQYRKIL